MNEENYDNRELSELLKEAGFIEQNSFQKKITEAFKIGSSFIAEGPEGSGKTTSIILNLLDRIKEAGEGSPRAIVVCKNDDEAIALHAKLISVAKYKDLTVDLANDKGNMLQQRNDIFDGTEVIIGTPKRIHDLYIQNGFNVGKIRYFILDDALDLFRNGHKIKISRLTESLPKCLIGIFTTNSSDHRIKEYVEEFIGHYKLIHS